MYNSDWVQRNASVRGFVFDWDIFAQVRSNKRILVQKLDANAVETWRCESHVTLQDFLAQGLPANTVMIEPDVWNYPGIDGFYVISRRDGSRLIAWNASIASTHRGNIHRWIPRYRKITQSVLFFRSHAVEGTNIPTLVRRWLARPGSKVELPEEIDNSPVIMDWYPNLLYCLDLSYSSTKVP